MSVSSRQCGIQLGWSAIQPHHLHHAVSQCAGIFLELAVVILHQLLTLAINAVGAVQGTLVDAVVRAGPLHRQVWKH